MKRICTSLFIAFLLLFHMAPLAYAAEGRITVTYNNGGTLQVLSAVKMEGNIIYVTDDTKVELIAVPDDGYEVAGVYLNDQSMNISGSGPQNILIAPNGTSVYLRITFVRSENANQYNPNSPSDSLTSPSGETDESVSDIPEPPPSQEPDISSYISDADPEPSTQPGDGQQANSDAVEPDTSPEPPTSNPDESPPPPVSVGTFPASDSISDAISDEIRNGGVGLLSDQEIASEKRASRNTTVLIVVSSLILATIVTIVIIKKDQL